MCKVQRSRLASAQASAQASAKALKPPSDPSCATTMRLNMSHLLRCRSDFRQEPFLRDHRRHHGAADHRGEEDRILFLVDDVMVSPYNAEMEPKVRPVDINSVVYMPSRLSNL